MNTNQEEIRSEEVHVASLRQALQRMHDDPAEAARIDSIIEDAELPVQQAPDRNHHQHVVVNVSGGEHNTVEISGFRRDPEHVPLVMPDHPRERSRPVPEVQITRTRALTTTASLTLMTTIALFAMQGGPAVLSAVLSIVAAATAGLHVLLSGSSRTAVLKSLLHSRQEARRELDPH
ncbi:hypothetical protein ACH437_14905 [Streptomyces xinghaiensis]|uniref:hypothetical protein n=1 Tax=Streptomyces xinghaiensis TaxID=1038928 RepID=UPI0037B28370